MSHYGLKVLLRGLTALFLVSFLFGLGGCAGKKPGFGSESFYPEYYAAKKLDDKDVITLRRLSSSLDPYVSSSAALLLGAHYLRYGDKAYGRFLIEKSYSNPNLDPQMKLYGKIWKMESLLSEGDDRGARALATEIKAMKKDDFYNRVMKIYCGNLGIRLTSVDSPDKCIDYRLSGSYYEAPVSGDEAPPLPGEGGVSTDNMTYDEYLKMMGLEGSEAQVVPEPLNLPKNADINVVGGDVMSEAVQGMIYAISKLGGQYKVNSVSESVEEKPDRNSVLVKLEKLEVLTSQTDTFLGIDWEDLTKTAANLKMTEGYDMAVISSTARKIPLARNMLEVYKNRGMETELLNYENPSFQAQLRNALEKAVDKKVIMIGLGTEDEILNFIPVAKFLQTDAETQSILLVMSSISDVREKPEYSVYFKDAFVITPVQTVNNRRFKALANDYQGFFGAKMNIRNMLGYDTIVYINSLTEPAAEERYITNIGGFYNGAAYRSLGLYSFNKNLEFRELKLDLIKEAPEIEQIKERENQQ